MSKDLMLAAVLHSPGDLRIEKQPIPKDLAPNDVLVKVKAAGICGSDLDRVMKTGTYSFPRIPGHEFSGVIAAIGSKVKNFSIGDRVLVAPIIPCFHCEYCQSGNFGQCSHYDYLGSRSDGGFSEFVKVPSRNLIILPSEISFIEGAAIEPAAVTLHGINRIKITAGDSVAILGCGAIGIFAIQFAKIMGATEIIGVDISDEKLAFGKKAGCTKVINALKDNPVDKILEATQSTGVNVCIETAGTPITQVQSIQCTKKHGRILYLGTAHKDVIIPPHVFEHIVRNEITLTGSWNSYSAPFPGSEWRSTIEYLQQKRLDIQSFITHTFPLQESPRVISEMANHEFSFNKVILTMD
ncbi:MAG: galactitol-1-phosphate 5-dehydrogenase [Eubacteriaceae bacterium]